MCEERTRREWARSIPVDIAGKGARNAEIPFDERLIYNQFYLFIREVPGTPGFDLIAKRIEIALNPVHPDRERIHDREVLRMLRQNRRELTLE